MSKKLDSLNLLHKLGLNTPKVVLVIPEHAAPAERNAIWQLSKSILKDYYVSPKKASRYSLRTARGNENTTPHHPNLSWNRCCTLVPQLIKGGYEIIVQEGINPTNCLFRGNFVHHNKKVLIEYMEGKGTVRDLEKGNPTLIEKPADYLFPDFIKPVVEDLIRLLPEYSEQIFEWSIYKDLIGRQKQHQIYWEIRPWQ